MIEPTERSAKPHGERRGILAGGNFITDFVKIIESWPEQDNLVAILGESTNNGGGPYNLLKDLAALEVDLPLEAAGRVGDDANGRWILDDCRRAGIGVDQLLTTDAAPTSYTDAMTVAGTGRRTFFHQQGANATLVPGDFDFSRTRARIFLLGYIMLLRSLDRIDADGRTGASRILEEAVEVGLITATDFVSANDSTFRAVALASLPYVDLLFLNELEAGRILERKVRAEAGAMQEAAGQLLELGVREAVILHCAEGAVTVTKEGAQHLQGKVLLTESEIAGTTGAGDAFAAGFLYGWHEGLSPQECLEHAVCVAACSLSAPGASEGVRPLADCLALGASHGYADF